MKTKNYAKMESELSTIGGLLPDDAKRIIEKVKRGWFPTGLTWRQQIILGWF